MTLREFIKTNRSELHSCVDRVVPNHKRNDDELKMWILNDEGLYRWARSEGVRI